MKLIDPLPRAMVLGNYESWSDPEKRKDRQSRTILNRWGTPEDLVGAVTFLSCEMSSYMTGQTLVIDGGWSIKGL